MRRSFKRCSLAGWPVLLCLAASSASAAVHYIVPIGQSREALATDNGGTGDYVAEALKKIPAGDTNSVTKTAAVPEVSTWGMMLLWFVGVALALVRRSRRSSGVTFD